MFVVVGGWFGIVLKVGVEGVRGGGEMFFVEGGLLDMWLIGFG